MSRKNAIVFFGIIAAGAGISLVTLLGLGKKQIAPTDPTVTESKEPDMPSQAKPAQEDVAKQAKTEEKPTPPALPEGTFPTPAAAMSALADVLGKKNFETFEKTVGPEAIAQAERAPIQTLIENPDWKLDSETPHAEISKAVGAARWSLNFVKETSIKEKETKAADLGKADQATPGEANLPERDQPALDATKPAEMDLAPAADSRSKATHPTETNRLFVDLKEQVPGAFRIEKVTLPLSTAPGKPGSTPASTDDALTVTQAFSDAVMRHDYAAARALSDPATVTDERVAALMIAIEEGNFTLKKQRPFVVTLSRDDVTWVLAQVTSETASSEYAVELNHKDGKWLIAGLTFSKMLSTLSEMAGGSGVAYTPIIENPEGGDSLVLYFEFDNSNVTQRTGRQLDIIAKILKQNEKRLIHITGHADALGSDPYNDALSEKRAEVIRQSLIDRGVKADQVVTKAFGSAKPRMPNFKPDGSDNPSGRSANRRAEVYLDF